MRRKKEYVINTDDAREEVRFMSPDKKELDATRQEPDAMPWDGSDEEMLPFSYEQDEVGDVDSDQLAYAPDDDQDDQRTEQLPGEIARFETLKKIGRQISPIVTPLLFGGITFLFLLPLLRTNQFYLHGNNFWPVGLVITAIVILQGMLLYYAGTNNVYWSLGIVGGFFLFLMIGCFALFGPFSALALLVVLLIASMIAARFATHPVLEGSVDIVYAFGAYSRTLTPGLNFMLPWEKVIVHLNTKERQWTCPEQTVPVSRGEDVHLKAVISYQLMPVDAHLAILQVENWEESVRELFKTLLQSAVVHLTQEDFLAWPEGSRSRPGDAGGMRLNNPEREEGAHWAHINLLLTEQMQERVAGWGVTLNWVYIRDVTLTPRSNNATNATSGLDAAKAKASPPPVQAQAQPSFTGMGTGTAGRIKTPPVMGNQVPSNIITQQTEAMPRPAAAPVTPPASGTKLPKEEVLKNAYKQIQSGLITSPDVIRSIATSFQAIANDPEAIKNVSFDASQAARTLFERAKLIEESENVAPVASPMSSPRAYQDNVPTQSGWSYRAPSDDNLTAGG